MANWRPTGTRCPLDEDPAIRLSKCQPCRFFRGASSPPREPWKMLCNWPRNGSTVEMPEVPQAFREAFDQSEAPPPGSEGAERASPFHSRLPTTR